MLLIRPDSWNFPVILHVGGAMVLVGSLAMAGLLFVQSWREREPETSSSLFRFGALTMFFAVLPSFIVMRGAAEWALSREHLENSNASWIGIGFATADFGGLLLIISLILCGIAVRRVNRGGAAGKLARIGGGLALLLIALYVVAIWAMTTKPS
jgi:uncharacterized membrane protein